MYKVTFSQSDVKNLAIFLERITLKGNEVASFNAIINALNTAEKIELPKTVEERPQELQDTP